MRIKECRIVRRRSNTTDNIPTTRPATRLNQAPGSTDSKRFHHTEECSGKSGEETNSQDSMAIKLATNSRKPRVASTS